MVCADKLLTTLALAAARVPQPDTRVAFDTESAMQAINDVGLSRRDETCYRVMGAAAGAGQ
ncbi:MAG: hypothetical protein H6671_00345 [Anaerolineaceae bacterium]|nr:hypothetical protein [Anaerolineaceae bacterium]